MKRLLVLLTVLATALALAVPVGARNPRSDIGIDGTPAQEVLDNLPDNARGKPDTAGKRTPGRPEQNPRRGQVEVSDAKPILTPDTWGNAPRTGRLMIVVDGPITDSMLQELGTYAQIHGWVDSLSMVTLTPKGPRARATIEGLPFVEFVEEDQPRYLTDGFGTWDRDILDVTDVDGGDRSVVDAREVDDYTGAGVYVAVIDTGLPKNWQTFLPDTQVDTDLARAFMGGGAVGEDFVPVNEFNTSNPTNMWEHDTNGHGMAVASHVIGFKIGPDTADGVAPDAMIIPLKVFPNGEAFTWSSRIIAAIDYVTWLKTSETVDRVVINMSLGGGAPGTLDRAAINNAINAGVIVVASAGNAGEDGMGWPGAYPEVISVGAIGWTEQFRFPSVLPARGAPGNGAFWWDSDVGNDPDSTGTSEEEQAYVTFFSSRALPALGAPFGTTQELDLLAPGLWTVAPFGHGPNASFFFIGGTSFSSPLTAGVAALMLEKNGALMQGDVESIMKTYARPLVANDSRTGVFEPFITSIAPGGFYDPSWDTDCNNDTILGDCDPVGAGLLDAVQAVANS